MTTVYKKEKTEIVTWMDGNLKRTKKVKLVTYDGISWAMDDKRAHTRFKRASRLRPKFGKDGTRRVAAESTRKEAPVSFPVVHHGAVMLGKAKGKNQKYKRNLRVKKEQNVQSQVVTGPSGEQRVLSKVHIHRCHSRIYYCCCGNRWAKRPCGGDRCLRKATWEELKELITASQKRRSIKHGME